MAEIDFEGVPLAYHVHGEGETVIVAVPGGQGLFWDYLRMPAVEENATVVYLEPLGTGASGDLPTHPHGYTRAVHARALDRLLDHLGHERVHLLGHSYGAFIAQHYALTRPQRLHGVILYESVAAVDEQVGAEVARQVGLFVERHAGHPEVPAVLAALQTEDENATDDELTATLRAMTPCYFADYWAREAEFAPFRDHLSVRHVTGDSPDGTPDPIDDRAALPGLAVPALVVNGRYDLFCGERWGRELLALIPEAQLLVLDHSGHYGHVEEAARFARAVTEWSAVGAETAT